MVALWLWCWWRCLTGGNIGVVHGKGFWRVGECFGNPVNREELFEMSLERDIDLFKNVTRLKKEEV